MDLDNLEKTRQYLALLENFESEPAAYRHLLHPEIEQTEFPNALTKTTKVRGYVQMLEGARAGRQLLSSQSFDVQNVIGGTGDEEHLALEVLWTGTIAADIGTFRAGQTLTANFCMVLEFKDGLLYRQRNYDCFQPFS
jgi:ketosteroid isomerase-like protein